MNEVTIFLPCSDCEGTGYLVCSECEGMGTGTGEPCQMCEGESWEEICGICDGQGDRPINIGEWFKENLKEAQITQIETDEVSEIMVFFGFGEEFAFDAKTRIEKIKDAARALQVGIKAIQGYDDRVLMAYVQVVTFEIIGYRIELKETDE